MDLFTFPTYYNYPKKSQTSLMSRGKIFLEFYNYFPLHWTLFLHRTWLFICKLRAGLYTLCGDSVCLEIAKLPTGSLLEIVRWSLWYFMLLALSAFVWLWWAFVWHFPNDQRNLKMVKWRKRENVTFNEGVNVQKSFSSIKDIMFMFIAASLTQSIHIPKLCMHTFFFVVV